MKMKKILLIALGMLMVTASVAMADSKPIQLSLTPDVAIYNKTTNISGVSLNIWGENPQKGFALGFVNGSSGDSAGFSLGILFNYAENYTGVQWAPVNYAKKGFTGWQLGVVNITGGETKGLQTSAVNIAGNLSGVQLGAVNYAGQLKGLQLGAINYAAKATAGVQIGVINIIPDNAWFVRFPGELAPGMVIFNWRF